MTLGWFLAVLLLLAIPSSNITRFDGLPFSGIFEFAVFLLVLPFLVSQECRDALDQARRRIGMPLFWMWVLPLGLLILKLGLLASGEQAGWDACYSSPASPVDHYYGPAQDLACERSYENSWGISAATRLEANPSYRAGITVPIFFNTLRYDYYPWVPGNILRNRLPVDLRWQTSVSVPADRQVDVRYVGEGLLTWGEKTYQLPPSYQETAVVSFLSGSPEAVSVSLEYHFDDGVRSGQDENRWGPSGFLALALPAGATVQPSRWIVLGWISDAGWFLLAGILLAVLVWAARRDWSLLLVAAGLAAVVYRVPGFVLLRELFLTAILVGVFLWDNLRRRLHPVAVYAMVLLVGLLLIRIWYPGWDTTALRSAGNDPLGFESQAYSILAGRNLEGGESVFYAQPLYRYVKFAEHSFFGDGDVLYAGLQLAAFLGGVWLLFSRNLSLCTQKKWRALWLVMGCALIGLGGYYVSQMIREGMPEYVTWTALVWAVPWLFLHPSQRGVVAGMALLAAAAITRTNQLPGLMFLLFCAGVVSVRKRPIAVLVGGALAAFLLLLPLAHNLWFGHEFVLFTSSAGANTNLTAPPAVWLAGLGGDPVAQGILVKQLQLLFLASGQPLSVYPTLAILLVCALFYIVTFLRTWRTRRIAELILLASPLFFLVPHLMFVLQTYYPRHIIAIYLSMAVISAVIWLREPWESPSPSLR